jgi:phage/plasmid-like protein (TIGR03299 family)
MPAEFESGVFARQKAWHGHGTVVEGALTTKEAFEKSGLDWPGGVEKRPLFTVSAKVDPNARPESLIDASTIKQPGYEAIKGFLPSPLLVPDQSAVVRVMDNTILGVVGPAYQVIQNVAMFDFLDALTAGEDKVAKWESAGSLRGGRSVWALLNLPDSEIMVGKEDRLLPYLLITNAHDGTAACRVIPTVVRVVCDNTLRAAVAGEFRDLTVSIRHTGDVASKIAEAKLMLAQAGAMFGAFEKVANELAATTITRESFDMLMESLFPTPEEDATDAVKTRVENNRTLLAAAVVEEQKLLAAPNLMNYWTVLNGVTRWVDHSQKVQLRGREGSEARFENSLVGRGADFKTKAAAAIIDLARKAS